jgi:hypothetical protein
LREHSGVLRADHGGLPERIAPGSRTPKYSAAALPRSSPELRCVPPTRRAALESYAALRRDATEQRSFWTRNRSRPPHHFSMAIASTIRIPDGGCGGAPAPALGRENPNTRAHEYPVSKETPAPLFKLQPNAPPP